MSLTPYKPSDFLLFGCKALPAFTGAYRVSQVLVCFSTYMPRPDDSDRPSKISPFTIPLCCFCHVKNIAICIFTLNGAVPDFRGVRFPLWPICFPVYASCGSFGSIALSIRNLQNILDSLADFGHPVHLVPGSYLTGVSLFVF